MSNLITAVTIFITNEDFSENDLKGMIREAIDKLPLTIVDVKVDYV